MAKKTKLTAFRNGEAIDSRTTARDYVAAIYFELEDGSNGIVTWCGRPDLAEKAYRKEASYMTDGAGTYWTGEGSVRIVAIEILTDIRKES